MGRVWIGKVLDAEMPEDVRKRLTTFARPRGTTEGEWKAAARLHARAFTDSEYPLDYFDALIDKAYAEYMKYRRDERVYMLKGVRLQIHTRSFAVRVDLKPVSAGKCNEPYLRGS